MATPEAPVCGCCNGSGMHGHHDRPVGQPSPEDDWEGCTACGETGHTWHDRVWRDSCTGYKDLMRRVSRGARS